MLSSSRFVVAVHSLTILAKSIGRGPVCSKAIANSVHTNPVVIRRLMASLERAKLVSATAGRSGGFSLARNADSITLADIYESVEDDTVFRVHKVSQHTECPVAAQMLKALTPKLRNAEAALAASLRGTTLGEVAGAIG